MQENDIYKSRNYLATSKRKACFFKNKDTKVHDIPRRKGNLRGEYKKVSEIYEKTSEIFSKTSDFFQKTMDIFGKTSEIFIWQLGEGWRKEGEEAKQKGTSSHDGGEVPSRK